MTTPNFTHMQAYAVRMMSQALDQIAESDAFDNCERAALREALVLLAAGDRDAAMQTLADAVCHAFRPDFIEDRREAGTVCIALALLAAEQMDQAQQGQREGGEE